MASRDVPTTPGSATDAYEKTVATPMIGSNGKKKSSMKTIGNVCIGVGLLVAVAAVVVPTVLPSVVNSSVMDGVVTCDAADYEKESYLTPYGDCEDCTPYYYTLHMFNATNAQAHLEKGETLKLQEVGPYTYRRFDKTLDVEFDGEWVKYKKYSYYTFEEDLSCKDCSEDDTVIAYDVGYLNVLSSAGGESGFVRRLYKGTLAGRGKTDEEVEEFVEESGASMMRLVNGFNSMHPAAWDVIQPSDLFGFLLNPGSTAEKYDLSGFIFNGLFGVHPVKEWAKGYPSILAGLGLSKAYFDECQAEDVVKSCEACVGKYDEECLEISPVCNQCDLGKKVVASNSGTCDRLEASFKEKVGEERAKEITAELCRKCGEDVLGNTLPLCLAPLPGMVQSSGIDYSKQPPTADMLGEYIQNSGCKDKSQIGVYKQYAGETEVALWMKLDSRRNPTLEEIAASGKLSCKNPSEKLTCTKVRGNDATSIEPQGVSMSGFESEPSVSLNMIYLDQGKQNVSLFDTGVDVDVKDITLNRFSPANDMLSLHPWNEGRGTGYPVDGVQQMTFTAGFLAYLSYPLFLYGDKSLFENVEVTMTNGKVGNLDSMYNDGKLKEEYAEKYVTVVDVEAGLGKAMSARKRLMASYAVSELASGKPLSDLVWPKLKAEVIVPAYWGQESSEISDSKADSYNSISGLLGALVPILIVGLIVGVGLIAGGVFARRRANQAASKNPAGDA